jgi:soluble lytic murein transglycosylase-like protein
LIYVIEQSCGSTMQGCGDPGSRTSRIDWGGLLRRFAALLFFAAALTAGGTMAHADVLEIDDAGSVHVRANSAEVQWVSQDKQAAEGSAVMPDAIPDEAVTIVGTPQVPDTMRASLQAAAAHYSVSPDLLAALVWQESRFHANAVSPKGAVGLAQLMPGTARALSVDATDPAANLDGGAHYLRQMLDKFGGNVESALAAYNAGPGRVIRAGGLPRIAETRAYVSTIIDRLTPDISTGLAIK